MRGVRKILGTRKAETLVFENLNCSFRHGIINGVLGARGSGKSTLVSLMNGNLAPEAGEVRRPRTVSWPIASRQVFRKDISVRVNVRALAQMYGAYPPEMLDAVMDIAKLRRDELDKPIRESPDDVHSRATASLCYALNFNCYVADGQICGGSRSFREYMCDLFYARRSHHGFILVTQSLQPIREICETCYIIQNHQVRSFAKKGDGLRAFKGMTRGEVDLEVIEQDDND